MGQTNRPNLVDCLEDVNGDGNVDVEDLLELIAVWGPCESCAADFDANGMVDIGDLLLLIGAWGSCE